MDATRGRAPDIPVLLALDRGTSSLRALLVSGTSEVLGTRHAPWGILHLPAPAASGGFAQAFAAIGALPSLLPCSREILGARTQAQLDNPAPRGLLEFARAAGVLH